MKGAALIAAALVALAGCAPEKAPPPAAQAAPTPPAAQEEAPSADWPRTCHEAIDRIVSAMSDADKAALRKDKREDLVMYHFGWGTGIRNSFGLWGGNTALAEDCATRFGKPDDPQGLHPDVISGIIIEQVWKAVQ